MAFRVPILATVLTFVNAFLLNGTTYTKIPSSIASLNSAISQSSYPDITSIVPPAILSDDSARSYRGDRIIGAHGTAAGSSTTKVAETAEFFLPYTSIFDSENFRVCKRSVSEIRKWLWDQGLNHTALEEERVGIYTGKTPEQLMTYVRTQPDYLAFGTRLDLGSLGALTFTPYVGQGEVLDVAIKSAITKIEQMKARSEEFHYDEGIFFEFLVDSSSWRAAWEPCFGKRTPIAAWPRQMQIL